MVLWRAGSAYKWYHYCAGQDLKKRPSTHRHPTHRYLSWTGRAPPHKWDRDSMRVKFRKAAGSVPVRRTATSSVTAEQARFWRFDVRHAPVCSEMKSVALYSRSYFIPVKNSDSLICFPAQHELQICLQLKLIGSQTSSMCRGCWRQWAVRASGTTSNAAVPHAIWADNGWSNGGSVFSSKDEDEGGDTDSTGEAHRNVDLDSVGREKNILLRLFAFTSVEFLPSILVFRWKFSTP